MPGEFNDLIPLPRRNPRRDFRPGPFDEILAGPAAEDAFFDADDVSFTASAPVPAPASQRSVQTPLAVILAGQMEDDPIGPPRPTPAFSTPESAPERKAPPAGSNVVNRIGDAIGRGANRPFREDRPIGLDPKSVQFFREIGLFNGDPNNPSLLGTANEVLIGGGTALADLALRGLAAAGEGGIAAIGQTARELGASQGQAKRLERDIRAGLTALSLAGAAAPVAAAGLPTAVRVRRMKRPRSGRVRCAGKCG